MHQQRTRGGGDKILLSLVNRLAGTNKHIWGVCAIAASAKNYETRSDDAPWGAFSQLSGAVNYAKSSHQSVKLKWMDPSDAARSLGTFFPFPETFFCRRAAVDSLHDWLQLLDTAFMLHSNSRPPRWNRRDECYFSTLPRLPIINFSVGWLNYEILHRWILFSSSGFCLLGFFRVTLYFMVI